MDHPAISRGKVAVITGGASGIGLATARLLASRGMRVCIADRNEGALEAAVASIDGDAFGQVTDVSELTSVESLRATVVDRWGPVSLLMNNAGTGSRGVGSWNGIEGWRSTLGVNLWGVIHGMQVFAGAMVASGEPGAIINTGSKQGITNPPGNPAYNVSKAGIKAATEHLAHELRNQDGCAVTAHLLVPGFTYTGMISAFVPEKPAAAWTPEQVAERLLASLGRGDFYIICPDNDVTESMDHGRMQWNLDDIVENRPALSRWHPDHAAAFEAFMATRDDG